MINTIGGRNSTRRTAEQTEIARFWGYPLPPITTDFMQEVALALINGGVHYRNSTVVGTATGKQVGELTAAKHLKRSD